MAYLKVTPFKGIRRFQVRGKLAPRFIGPFRITARKGAVAYQLDLPPSLSDVHNVFHVSQLKKCLRPPLQEVSLQDIEIQPDLTYTEHPICILDETERVTRNRAIKFLKVQWSNHPAEEATWEREDWLMAEFPSLFSNRK